MSHPCSPFFSRFCHFFVPGFGGSLLTTRRAYSTLYTLHSCRGQPCSAPPSACVRVPRVRVGLAQVHRAHRVRARRRGLVVRRDRVPHEAQAHQARGRRRRRRRRLHVRGKFVPCPNARRRARHACCREVIARSGASSIIVFNESCEAEKWI